MSYQTIESFAFDAILNGAESVDSVVSYILTACEASYTDAKIAAENAFRKIHQN